MQYFLTFYVSNEKEKKERKWESWCYSGYEFIFFSSFCLFVLDETKLEIPFEVKGTKKRNKTVVDVNFRTYCSTASNDKKRENQ